MLDIDAKDQEEIPRYAVDDKRGGWETRLVEASGWHRSAIAALLWPRRRLWR